MDFWHLISALVSYISCTVYENNPYTSAFPQRNKIMVSSLIILKFLSPLWLFIYMDLFCKLQWSILTPLLQLEFNSSKVLTACNNFGLDPTAGCMGNKTFKTKKCHYVHNKIYFSIHYNEVGLATTVVVIKREWKEKHWGQ